MLATTLLAVSALPQVGAFQDVVRTVPFANRILVRDVDADGDDDVVAVSGATGAVELFRRGSDGLARTSERIVDLGEPAPYVELVDLDLDGDLDVIALRSGYVLVSFLNGGAAGFGEAEVLLDTGIGGGFQANSRIEVVEAVGDARPEIAFFRSDVTTDNQILLGSGLYGGTFSSQVIATANAVVQAMTAADFDGDGDRDLAFVDIDGLRYVENLGGGLFAAPVEIEDLTFANSNSNLLASGDVDGDGNQDLALRIANRRFEVYLGAGNGTFGEPLPVDSSLGAAFVLALEDLDADGDADVIASTDAVGGFGLVSYESLGAGAFAPRAQVDGEDANVRAVAFADLDGDGGLEVLHAADPGALRARRVTQGAAGLAISASPREFLEAPDAFDGAAAADVDGDGRDDLITFAGSAGELQWRRSLGGGCFDPPQSIATDVLSGIFSDIVASDFNADGNIDFVLDSANSSDDLWVKGLGAGNFAPAQSIGPASVVEGAFSVGDLDGDGLQDLVRTRFTEPAIRWYRGLPGGSFAPSAEVALVPRIAGQVAPGDIDGDGNIDLVVDLVGPASGDSEVGVLYGMGGAVFGPFQQVAFTAAAPESYFSAGLAAADIGGDGDIDLVRLLTSGLSASATWTTRYELYENTGGGAFLPAVLLGDVPGRVVDEAPLVADVDGNGALDVVSRTVVRDDSSATPESIAVLFRGLGSGAFAPADRARDSLPSGGRLSLADFDEDGDLDFVSASSIEQRIGWFETLTSGSIGLSYCGPAVVNSSGRTAKIEARGSAFIATNDVTLAAFDLPPKAFTAFLASRDEAISFPFQASDGRLCIAAPFGVFDGPGQIARSDGAGTVSLRVDTAALPGATGASSVLTGETVRFQAWFRDDAAASGSSNLTDAVRVVFL